MSLYEIRLTKEARKDVQKLSPRMKKKLKDILTNKIALEPYTGKKLVGQLKGFYSVRLNYQDRIVYSIDDESRIIFIHRTKTHYAD